MYVIAIYIPESHCDAVKEAMFQAGAGQIGAYSRCAWQTLGQGQFQPETQSHAFIGEKHTLSFVSEYKVEMVCEESCLSQVIQALKQAHPYETPAYHIVKCYE